MRILLLLIIFPSLICNAQEEYQLQPIKLLKANNVRKIYKFDGKNELLTDIIEYDSCGRVIKVTKPVSIRKYQLKEADIKPENITYYEYSDSKILNITDTVYQNPDFLNQMNFVFIDSASKDEFFNRSEYVIRKTELSHYSDGSLKTKKFYNEESEIYYFKEYSYEPLSIKTQLFKDSIVIDEFMVEYERDYYIKEFYGFSLNPLVKDSTTNIQYQDYKKAKKEKHQYSYDNQFDSEGRLIRSNVLMHDIRGERKALHIYKYNKKGLLEQSLQTIYSDEKEMYKFIKSFDYEFE